jgi:uncharacterized membrane protein
MSLPQILLRWLHIVPAVVAGGAVIYARIALVPALAEQPEAERARLRAAIDARWRPVVMACITLLLASGVLGFVLYEAPAHKGQALYHALFGVKFLAALGVFFLASALSGRTPALAPIRARSPFWTGIAATLVVVILLIAGVLRSIPPST